MVLSKLVCIKDRSTGEVIKERPRVLQKHRYIYIYIRNIYIISCMRACICMDYVSVCYMYDIMCYMLYVVCI